VWQGLRDFDHVHVGDIFFFFSAEASTFGKAGIKDLLSKSKNKIEAWAKCSAITFYEIPQFSVVLSQNIS
jgi:hypothetical protein